jgi:hypothetical protein
LAKHRGRAALLLLWRQYASGCGVNIRHGQAEACSEDCGGKWQAQNHGFVLDQNDKQIKQIDLVIVLSLSGGGGVSIGVLVIRESIVSKFAA